MALPLVFGGTIAWLFIGIAALLLWLAVYYLLAKPLSSMVRKVPGVGQWIANAIMDGANAVGRWAYDWTASAANTVVELASVPIRAIWDAINWSASAIEWTERAIKEVASVAAGQVGSVARSLNDLASKVSKTILQAASAAATAAASLLLANTLRSSTIPAARQSAVNESVGYTNARAQVLQRESARAIDDVRLDLGRAIDGERSARNAADLGLAGAAAATAAALRARIAAEGAGARAYTDQRTGALDQELARLRDVALPAALAAALAATATLTNTLTQVRTRCIDPMCSVFGPSVDLWRSLMTGAELALVLSLVGSAVRDPEGTAQAMTGVADVGHSMASGLLAPIIGRP